MILNWVRRSVALLVALTAVAGGARLSVLDALLFHRVPSAAHARTMDDASRPAAHGATCTLEAQLPAWLPAPAIAEAPGVSLPQLLATATQRAVVLGAGAPDSPHSRAPPRA